MSIISPKDPEKKGKGFFVMYDSKIEATMKDDNTFTQEIFLEGRLKEYVENINNISDTKILTNLETFDGIRQMVTSIGVSINAKKEGSRVNFVLQNYGKTDKFSSGTTIRVPILADGLENIIKLDDYKWTDEEDILGRFSFEFESEGELADAFVKFYVKDEYDIEDSVIDKPIDTNSSEYIEMIKKSLVATGNNVRLKKAIDKARNKEEVTIAFIGGSITQGAGAKPINTESYAYKFYDGFGKMFDTDNVKLIKAGVGGTSSELGMIRFDRDILRGGSVKPDIVVVEFSVNDAEDETKGICYESLVKMALSLDNEPAVILLFSVFADGYNLQERHIPIGKGYALPMVSLKNAMNWELVSKRQYFYDIFHPTNLGHTIMADCLLNMVKEVDSLELSDAYELDKIQPVLGDYFKDVYLYDNKEESDYDTVLQSVELDKDMRTSPQFVTNFQIQKERTWTFNSRGCVLVFKDTSENDFGKADVYLDGEYLRTCDPHLNNWVHCNTAIVYMNDEASKHTVTVRLSDGDEDKKFTVLGFGIVD